MFWHLLFAFPARFEYANEISSKLWARSGIWTASGLFLLPNSFVYSHLIYFVLHSQVFCLLQKAISLVFWKKQCFILWNALLGKIRTGMPTLFRGAQTYHNSLYFYSHWLIRDWLVNNGTNYGCRRPQIPSWMFQMHIVSIVHRWRGFLRSCRAIQIILVITLSAIQLSFV